MAGSTGILLAAIVGLDPSVGCLSRRKRSWDVEREVGNRQCHPKGVHRPGAPNPNPGRRNARGLRDQSKTTGCFPPRSADNPRAFAEEVARGETCFAALGI